MTRVHGHGRTAIIVCRCISFFFTHVPVIIIASPVLIIVVITLSCGSSVFHRPSYKQYAQEAQVHAAWYMYISSEVLAARTSVRRVPSNSPYPRPRSRCRPAFIRFDHFATLFVMRRRDCTHALSLSLAARVRGVGSFVMTNDGRRFCLPARALSKCHPRPKGAGSQSIGSHPVRVCYSLKTKN